MTVTELIEKLAEVMRHWGDIEVQLDDGLEIRDDVVFKVYADPADPPAKVMVSSPESMERMK